MLCKVFYVILQAKSNEMRETAEIVKKEEVRDRIIKCASELFLTHGIKDIKMDDIAKELSMSKRTIYEQFTDKKQLLFECLRTMHKYLEEQTRPYIKDPRHNTLDLILYLYDTYFKLLNSINKNFFIELAKYPEIIENKEKRERLNERKFMAWMQKGVEEGIFREDTNFEIVQYILKRDVELLSTTNEFPKYSANELGRTFILFYLRGIATEKGQAIIEKYITNDKKQ